MEGEEGAAAAGQVQLEVVRPTGRCVSVLVCLLLVIHTGLLGWLSAWNGPNLDESAHLASGWSHWEFGNFTLYRVNPPLIRMWAAAPLLMDRPESDWSSYSDTPFSRSEFSVGRAFHAANGEQAFWYLQLARWSLIPVSLLGAWVCFRWAAELYGDRAGVLVVALWCFCPNMLTWGASLTPDIGSAAFGVLAGWRFWKWLQTPSWKNALLAGATLGLVELVKSTWIVLFGLWPVLWVVWRFGPRRNETPPPFKQLCCVLLLALYLLNLGYGFEATGESLEDFTFISETLGGDGAHDGGGNRFQGTWLGRIPVPLPANYVRGIDVQKYDFEEGKWSYLHGEHRKGGWWYYYVYAFLVKTPLGYLVLCVLATGLAVALPRGRRAWRDEMLLIVPGLLVLLLVSSQTGFNRYLRYLLPAFPFLYVFVARVAMLRGRAGQLIVAGALLAGITSSLLVFPYSMSYFNQAVGGPSEGHRHLLDGNLDWGQDLLRLKSWLDDHPEAQPLYTSLTTFVPLESAGIDSEDIPEVDSDSTGGLSPGWYAIGVNRLMGYRMLGSEAVECRPFRDMQPVARIGYSISIFHVEGDEDASASEK